jgi:hypothetical protein
LVVQLAELGEPLHVLCARPRCGWRGRRGLRGRWRSGCRRLLARLVGLLLLLFLLARTVLAHHVRAASDRCCTQQRTASHERHRYRLPFVLGQREPEREHDLGSGRHDPRSPDLRRDRSQHA